MLDVRLAESEPFYLWMASHLLWNASAISQTLLVWSNPLRACRFSTRMTGFIPLLLKGKAWQNELMFPTWG
jgi:hypothetical protein